MLYIALFFLSGDLLLQQFTTLPSMLFIAGLIAVAAIALLKKHHFFYLTAAFILGFSYTAWYAHHLQSAVLAHEDEGKIQLIQGEISALPKTNRYQKTFIVNITKSTVLPRNTLIRLVSSNQNLNVHLGDEWHFMVKLKRIHSTENPGGFDYEAHALQQGIRASGYVVEHPNNKFLAHHYLHYPILQLREKILTHLMTLLPQNTAAKWLPALMLGVRSDINLSEWGVLRRTGTNHLMAIAGLHIGIMAWLIHTFTVFIWRLFPSLMLRLPAKQAGYFAALCIAWVYSALAGFSIPTERACLMLTFYLIVQLTRTLTSAFTIWGNTLLVVLLLNPLSILTESFWLSFCTLALVIYGMHGRLAPQGLWWKWGRVQWVIGFGLIPFSIFFFQECSLISFIANCIAIPWLSFFILPFCLLAYLLIGFAPTGSQFCLLLASKSLMGLWAMLTWFATLPFAAIHLAIPNVVLLLTTLIGVILLLLPDRLPGRWFGLIWLLPLICYQPPKPPEGDYWLTLLDVGQGLSVVVQTKTHILVYDTGPAFLNTNMGEQVLLPYLQQINAKKIAMLVVSHGDNDHIGGASALLSALPVALIKTSVPEKLPYPHTDYCHAFETWEWDHVTFSFLYPPQNLHLAGNNSSCVLLISSSQKNTLLTGDIERPAQKYLLGHLKDQLLADILVVPHHGSKTSAMPAFIQAVHPKIALYAVGYRNRYHFPHPSVSLAYQAIAAKQVSTAFAGAISVTDKLTLTLYRKSPYHYWYDD